MQNMTLIRFLIALAVWGVYGTTLSYADLGGVATQQVQEKKSWTRKKGFGAKKSALKVAQGVEAALKALPCDPLGPDSVWDQTFLQQNPEVATCLKGFIQGTYALSVKDLKLQGLTVEELHARVIQAGFVEKSKTSDSKMTTGGDPRKKGYIQKIYVHTDGGMVRVKPMGQRGKSASHAVKCVLKDLSKGTDFSNEAFKVTEEGYPIPKTPRPGQGLRTAVQDLTHPDQIFGWVDTIMDLGHIELEREVDAHIP